jgi:hypothetical protein
MRRLISTLAAGLLAGGTALTGGIASASTTHSPQAAGIASASARTTHAPQAATCTVTGANNYFQYTAKGVNYYIGTPNTAFSGETAYLKPKENGTTHWFGEPCSDGSWLLTQRGLALTSTSFLVGQPVTVQNPGNGGNGFASQHWFFTFNGSGQAMLRNAKTNLYLRIPNSGPNMGQGVTTGNTPTAWAEPQ